MLLKRVITEDWVVDCHAGEVVVNRIVCIDKGVRDVRDIEAAVALTSQVNLSVLDLKGIDKAFVEANEFLAKLNFVGDVGNALCEADADGLLDPHHVGKVDPCIWVLSRRDRPRFPSKWAILGKQTAEGTTAWTSVEPKVCGKLGFEISK